MNTAKNRILIPALLIAAALIAAAAFFLYKPEMKEQTITVGQDSYSIASEGEPFNINAKGETDLSYESSDPSVAEVDEAGMLRGKKAGKATINITAEESRRYYPAEKSITVTVSDYTPASGRIAHSSGDKDERSGDSTGSESVITDYFYGPGTDWKDWSFIIRCNDPEISKKAAMAATYTVSNPNFGYNAWEPTSQERVDNRASIYKAVSESLPENPSLEDLKGIQKITKKADTSCTPTLMSGYWLYIDMGSKIKLTWREPYDKEAFYYYCGTANVEQNQLRQAIQQVNDEYTEKGMMPPFTIIDVPESERAETFDKANIKNTLKRGDIICSCPDPNKNGHTVMVL